MTRKAIDCLVNVHFGETEQQPTWMLKVRDDYFKGPDSMFAPVDLSELLDEMDEQGVAKAILMDNLAKPSVTARKFVESRPDRFRLAMGGVNLLKPMPSLRELTAGFNGLVVTTGGTGFGVRDLTPEGTGRVIERDAPGLAEAMRLASNAGGRTFGMLSRGVCGVVGAALVCNVPGSSNGARECLDAVLPALPHVLDLLAGKRLH